MPPRFAYWTILIDNAPTAFRAREREELLPTLHQLQRKNADVVLKWFARGRLWESPEAERAAQYAPVPTRERRGADWRPGGAHKDPRDRFKKKGRDEKKRTWADSGSTRPPGAPARPLRTAPRSAPRRPQRPPPRGPRGPRGPKR